MLYLAEVQKQKGGLLGGGGKTELKLLACQRTDQSWSNVSEEVIAAEEASKLNDGGLVLVELNPQRQVQRIQEAGRPLVNILQNFSRQLEKFKVKQDEIDQWKESLTFQNQELNRREMEMESRLEQLQQMEDDSQNLAAEKQEIETSRQEFELLREEFERNRQEFEGLRAEFERNRQELEGAWQHLRGEQRRLEEHQAEFKQGATLDEEQSRVLSELLSRLSNQVAPTESVREHLNFALEMVETQQAIINPHWQQLEQQLSLANQQQEEIDRLWQTFSVSQNECQAIQNSLQQQTAELKVNTATFNSKQEYAQMLKEQLRQQDELYQQIHSLASMSGNVILRQQVDVEALENMSVEELQKMVISLQEKLDIDSSFVNDQEQELKYKQEVIDELQEKFNQGSSEERTNLEIELVEENDLYQMLNQTLVGQRRSLVERQESLKQHQAVLLRRTGHTSAVVQDDQKLDLAPIMLQIEQAKQQQLQVWQNLEREIQQMRNSIELAQGMIENQVQHLEEKHQELKTMEENLLSLRTATAQCWGRVNLYQETLQPIQDSLNGLRSKLQGTTESLATVQETGDYQLQTINEIRQTILSLISQP